MKKIYIYGNKDFIKNAKSLLDKNLIETYLIIESTIELKQLLNSEFDSFYIIDNNNIQSIGILNKVFSIFKSKNLLTYKDLEKTQQINLNFSTLNDAINYITLEYTKKNIHQETPKVQLPLESTADITTIDDISYSNMKDALQNK